MTVFSKNSDCNLDLGPIMHKLELDQDIVIFNIRVKLIEINP